MNTDLMGTACFQMKLYQGGIGGRIAVENLVVGDCLLSMDKVHAPLNGGAVYSGNRCVDYAGFRFRFSLNSSQIGAPDFSSFHHIRKKAGAETVLGQNQKTSSIPIQAVYNAEGKWKSILVKIPGRAVGEGVVMISLGRMDWHSCRLIQDHQVFILINNRKWKTYWFNMRRILFRRKGNGEHLSWS